eukprot:CAMPEP_0116145466 /NCGR_PEP_ID=MMETSP0329-20121206/16608_1 /TAXON_ID=697910 /ORGANISM="Pseudo-nitzschia arenysensis, Strain B593" /LENGTH=502 /DNA_ID=CAMNT_0003641073 /DNA_START=51 /DNA_END=1559 /DNA_ORIENTATION=+
MKLTLTRAISVGVACLLAHSHGVDGAPSLRAGQKELKDSERKLNEYGPYNQPGPYNQHEPPFYGPGHINYSPPPPGYNPNPYGAYGPYGYGPYGYPVYPMTQYPLPTERPTPVPTPRPTPDPTPIPTRHPTLLPSESPSGSPSLQPIRSPTPSPTSSPTSIPTIIASASPTVSPTNRPTSASPTPSPIVPPTIAPTASPSDAPSPLPTASPSDPPTIATDEPSETPTETPTETDEPSENPTEEDLRSGNFPTIAETLCDEENYEQFLGFCVAAQLTGIDYILNNFEELDDEFYLLDDIPGLVDILTEEGLENMIDLLFSNEELRRLKDRTELAFQSLERLLALSVTEEAFVEGFLDKYYDVEIDPNQDFDTFMATFRDSNANSNLFTVFVPTNDAMDELNFRFENLSNVDRKTVLTKFAQNHIYFGERAFYYDDLECDKTRLKMWDDKDTRTECEGDRKYQVGKGNNLRPEINDVDLVNTKASNGLIQAINVVVIEPDDISP